MLHGVLKVAWKTIRFLMRLQQWPMKPLVTLDFTYDSTTDYIHIIIQAIIKGTKRILQRPWALLEFHQMSVSCWREFFEAACHRNWPATPDNETLAASSHSNHHCHHLNNKDTQLYTSKERHFLQKCAHRLTSFYGCDGLQHCASNGCILRG